MEVDSCSIRLRQTHGQHESEKKRGRVNNKGKLLFAIGILFRTLETTVLVLKVLYISRCI